MVYEGIVGLIINKEEIERERKEDEERERLYKEQQLKWKEEEKEIKKIKAEIEDKAYYERFLKDLIRKNKKELEKAKDELKEKNFLDENIKDEEKEENENSQEEDEEENNNEDINKKYFVKNIKSLIKDFDEKLNIVFYLQENLEKEELKLDEMEDDINEKIRLLDDDDENARSFMSHMNDSRNYRVRNIFS